MRKVYVIADNIYSPLGKNTFSNMEALKLGRSAIQLHESALSPEPFYAALFPMADKIAEGPMTALEQIVYTSALEAIRNSGIDLYSKKTGFILSSTKGNISLIENLSDNHIPEESLSLNTSAEIIAKRLGMNTEPLVVSHACISGLLAMITGMRLIQSGVLENVVISGGDLITSFIYSGFQSFMAISANPCRPFDADRDGITLGEAAATIILSSEPATDSFQITGGSVSNDANHISGPSRTGEELYLAIRRALLQAGLEASEIDLISAHGTATRYNDEMEARAIHLAKMESVPMNSLKGYYGHTLGAAGILESIVSIHSMKEDFILPTRGFATPGTEKKVQVVKEMQHQKSVKCLKTASGFGGCNAALIIVNS